MQRLPAGPTRIPSPRLVRATSPSRSSSTTAKVTSTALSSPRGEERKQAAAPLSNRRLTIHRRPRHNSLSRNHSLGGAAPSVQTKAASPKKHELRSKTPPRQSLLKAPPKRVPSRWPQLMSGSVATKEWYQLHQQAFFQGPIALQRTSSNSDLRKEKEEEHTPSSHSSNHEFSFHDEIPRESPDIEIPDDATLIADSIVAVVTHARTSAAQSNAAIQEASQTLVCTWIKAEAEEHYSHLKSYFFLNQFAQQQRIKIPPCEHPALLRQHAEAFVQQYPKEPLEHFYRSKLVDKYKIDMDQICTLLNPALLEHSEKTFPVSVWEAATQAAYIFTRLIHHMYHTYYPGWEPDAPDQILFYRRLCANEVWRASVEALHLDFKGVPLFWLPQSFYRLSFPNLKELYLQGVDPRLPLRFFSSSQKLASMHLSHHPGSFPHDLCIRHPELKVYVDDQVILQPSTTS